MGNVLDMMVKREEHFRDALGAKRDFKGWFAQMKVWIVKTEGELPYAKCSSADILSAFTAAAQLGLLIDGEECMVMVRGKAKPKVKCEICARGVVRKAGQAGWNVQARTVKEGDKIEIDEGQGTVKHTPGWLLGGPKGAETLGYYAYAVKRGGQSVVRTISYDEAQKRSTGTGAWTQWPDEMGEKTAVMSLRKVLYFGDEIEDLIASSGAEVGDTWALSDEEADAAQEPVHPPQSTRDKVLAQAARDEQDAAVEEPPPPEEEYVEPVEEELPI